MKYPRSDAERRYDLFGALSLSLGVLSLFLIFPTCVVGATVSNNIPFPLWLLVFTVPAVAAVCLSVIRKIRWARQVVVPTESGAAGVATSCVTLGIALLVLAAFLSFTEPRTGRVYAPVYASELHSRVSFEGSRPLRNVSKIVEKDSYIYANERSKGIHVIDNRNPSRPRMVAFYAIPGNVDMAIFDHTLYADSWTDLVVIDIRDPTHAAEVDRIEGVIPWSSTVMVERPGDEVKLQHVDAGKGPVVGWEVVDGETFRYRAPRPTETGSSCFPAGTPVATETGLRAIETIEPGSEIYAYDARSDKWTVTPVVRLQTSSYSGQIVTIQTGSAELEVTENHPFYVLQGDHLSLRPRPRDLAKGERAREGRGRWVEARDLRVGDHLLTRGGDSISVTALRRRHGVMTVYNLIVDRLHNYAVGSFGLLVHNKGHYETASSPASTGKAGSLSRFAIVGHYLYTLSNADLKVFDIQDPEIPRPWKTVRVGLDIETLFPYNDMLFIGAQGGMYLFDNRNPTAPVELSRFGHVRGRDPVVVQANRAYVTLRNESSPGGTGNLLEVVDIAQRENPSEIAHYPMTGPYGLSIDGKLLLVCDGAGGLKVFDASDPRNIRLQSTALRDDFPIDAVSRDHRAIVIARTGLFQLDYFDPLNVEIVSAIPAKWTPRPCCIPLKVGSSFKGGVLTYRLKGLE